MKNCVFPFVLLTDIVLEIITIDEDANTQIKENNLFNDCITSVILKNNQKIHVLSVDSLLLEEEKRKTSEFVKTAENRIQNI